MYDDNERKHATRGMTVLHRFCTKALIPSIRISCVLPTHLDESDGSRLLTEALTAKVDSVFADETSLVGAKAARESRIKGSRSVMMFCFAEPSFPSSPISSPPAAVPPRDRYVRDSPLTATLSVLSWSREPNSVVCHFEVLGLEGY